MNINPTHFYCEPPPSYVALVLEYFSKFCFFFQIVNKQLQLLGIPLSYVALVLEYFRKILILFFFSLFAIINKQLQLLGIPPSYVALVLEYYLKFWSFFQFVNKQLQLLGIPPSYVALVLEYFSKIWGFFSICEQTATAARHISKLCWKFTFMPSLKLNGQITKRRYKRVVFTRAKLYFFHTVMKLWKCVFFIFREFVFLLILSFIAVSFPSHLNIAFTKYFTKVGRVNCIFF